MMGTNTVNTLSEECLPVKFEDQIAGPIDIPTPPFDFLSTSSPPVGCTSCTSSGSRFCSHPMKVKPEGKVFRYTWKTN